MLAGLLLPVLAAGVVAAGPAAAVDDGAHPHARVTNGPSCAPGGVAVQVTGGSVGFHVVLATTRDPAGEDSADVGPGQTVVLHTRDVAYGETIDSRLEYTALDGSGDAFVDELTDWTFTRPAQADCAALSSPAPGVVPPIGPAPGGDPDAPPSGSAHQRASVQIEPAADRAGMVRPDRPSSAPAVIAATALLGTACWLGVVGVRTRARRGRPTVS